MRAAKSSQTGTERGLNMGMGISMNLRQGHGWLVWLLLLLLSIPPQMVDGRYLPTRSHGDDLDKLRELMLQILELSNEDPQQQQQQMMPQQHPLLRSHNEASSGSSSGTVSGSNTNTINPRVSNGNSNAAWLQKLSAMGALDELGGDALRMGPNYGRY